MIALRNTLIALAVFAYGFAIVNLGATLWPVMQ